MRRIVVVLGWSFLAAAAAAGGTVLWVGRELAAAERGPAMLCFTGRDQARLAAGAYGIGRKDLVVSRTAALRRKPRSMLLGHIQGATIHFVYTTFWRRQQREAAFGRIASKIRPCQEGAPREAEAAERKARLL